MIRQQQTLKSLTLTAVLIGIGLSGVSQNQRTITDYQLKQIRFLENQAKTDSIKVIKLNKALDTLHTVIDLKDIRLSNCDTIQMFQNEKIELQNVLIDTSNDKLNISEIEKNRLKKQVRNRTLLVIASAILNTIFIIKTIQ